MTGEAGDKVGKRAQRFARFEIVAHIASGGMGAVYKAYDPKTKQNVALKVMSPELAAKANMVRRFQREAMSAARLRHDNIVRVLEFGPEGDTFFLVLEFVDGKDLHEYIARGQGGRLAPDEARLIALQAAHALDHAHQNGVVHRDVKPSNFLITHRDGRTFAQLTDFGLATLSDDDEHRVTKAGTTLGTVDYMAPEQARDSGKADTRSDMYALGCTMFHMLTGRAPFNKGSLAERIMQHIEAEPPDVCKFNEAVSPGLGAVIRRLMAKKPRHRYQTPAELIADLENPDRALVPREEKEKKPRKVAAAAERTAERAAEKTERAERPRSDPAEPAAKKRKRANKSSWLPLAIAGGVVFVIAIVTLIIVNAARRPEDKKLVETKPDDFKPVVPIVEAKVPPKPAGPPEAELRHLYKPVLPLDPAALTAEYYGPFQSFPEPPAGAPVVHVSRAPIPGETTATTLQDAYKLLPAQGPCVVEIRDQGPHFLEALPRLEQRHLWVRAGPGHRPLLAWHVGAASTLLTLAQGNLTLENLDVVVHGDGAARPEPACVAAVQGGDWQARACTFTFAGKFSAGIVLAQMSGAAAVPESGNEPKFRLARCFVRGHDAVALVTRRMPIEALCDHSLIVGVARPLFQLSSSVSDVNNVRFIRSTLVAGPSLVEWQASDGKGGAPRLKGYAWDAVLARGDHAAIGEMLRLADGASAQLAGWKAVNALYAGWPRLLQAGDQTVANLDGWRTQWGHREGDLALAETWPPRFTGDPALLPAATYDPEGSPAGFRASAGNAALGCDLGRLPPEPPLWRPRTGERFTLPILDPPSADVPEIPTGPEGLYHGEQIDAGKVDVGLHLQARLQTTTAAPRIVLHLTGKGLQYTSPIRFRGVEQVVVYFEQPAPGGKDKVEPLTLDLKPGSDRSALIDVQGGSLDIRHGRFRFENSRIAPIPPYMVRVQGGDLRLTRCTLTGPLSKAPDSFRSLIGFEGAGVAAAQPHLMFVRECALLSGKNVFELRGAGYRVRAHGNLCYSLADAVAFDLGNLDSTRPDVAVVFAHNTVAVRKAFAVVRVQDAPTACLPIIVQAESNYFLDPFLDEPRQSSLLRAYADSLGRGLIAWQGKRNFFSDRWHAYAAFDDVVQKQTIAAWQRVGGPAGEIDPQHIDALPIKTFNPDVPAFDRLALPPSIRAEPLPGADLSRLGLIKKK